MTTETAITQEELEIYNSTLPKHLRAELWEMERVTIEPKTYPMAKRVSRTILRDRNYLEKYAKGADKDDPDAQYDENGYRITSDSERQRYLDHFGNSFIY